VRWVSARLRGGGGSHQWGRPRGGAPRAAKACLYARACMLNVAGNTRIARSGSVISTAPEPNRSGRTEVLGSGKPRDGMPAHAFRDLEELRHCLCGGSAAWAGQATGCGISPAPLHRRRSASDSSSYAEVPSGTRRSRACTWRTRAGVGHGRARVGRSSTGRGTRHQCPCSAYPRRGRAGSARPATLRLALRCGGCEDGQARRSRGGEPLLMDAVLHLVSPLFAGGVSLLRGGCRGRRRGS
jgi:hypothetical protein